MSQWIDASKIQPPAETPVLAIIGFDNPKIIIASLEWEHPSWEEGGYPFLYWAYTYGWDDVIEHQDVYWWTPLPEIPGRLPETKDLTYVEPPLF